MSNHPDRTVTGVVSYVGFIPGDFPRMLAINLRDTAEPGDGSFQLQLDEGVTIEGRKATLKEVVQWACDLTGFTAPELCVSMVVNDHAYVRVRSADFTVK